MIIAQKHPPKAGVFVCASLCHSTPSVIPVKTGIQYFVLAFLRLLAGGQESRNL